MHPLIEKIAATTQALLPQHLLTACAHRLMRVEATAVKNFQIRAFARLAGVDWSEAASADLDYYPNFNAFFTRALKPGVRSFAHAADALCCPCDGNMSELGRIEDDQLFQAKGHHYSLQSFLAGDPDCAHWRNGSFFTIYLSPGNYHRVHMPLDGRLRRMTHVPGRLFSVAPYTVRQVDRLFARNERVISIFDTAVGPVAVVLVGAMLVAGMETVWAGEVTPARHRDVRTTQYGEDAPRLARGEEMGRFNMGSTVVLLLPPGALRAESASRPGDAVKLGQALASLAAISAPAAR